MAMEDELPFKVVRDHGAYDDVLVGRTAYERAAQLYPKDLIEYRHGARIIKKSKNNGDSEREPCKRAPAI